MFLIKNVTIVAPNTKENGKKLDVLIAEGIIKEMGTNLTNRTAKVIEEVDLMLSPGWIDIGAQIGEPGLEHREDLVTVANAAAFGGYTTLACFPNTEPSIHSKTEVNFLKNNSQLVEFRPIGALSKNCQGVELAELYDMANAGAVAFSDGKKSIDSAGLLKRGLEYLKGIDGLLINTPFDQSLGKGGQIHEGAISTQLGMKGIPELSETLMLKRDLDLLAYTDSRLHVHNISTATSVKLVKAAKAKGLKVTASTAILNLIFDHNYLASFNENFKVLPPLRAKTDTKALVKALLDGTIDVLNANHVPWDSEAKNLEFYYAEFGAIGLETTFALLNTHLGSKLRPSVLVEILAIRPRKVLNLPVPKIEIGEKANLTLFSPSHEWSFSKDKIQSKSKNSPLIGEAFTGKVMGIFNGVHSALFLP